MSLTKDHGEGQGGWKIDELAHLSGVSVDTIRYYGREGLLPSAQRYGRGLAYGAVHLERLNQIRALQERHFTLAAIRDLAESGRLELLERLLDRGEQALSRDELCAQAGLDDGLIERLETIGFVSPPEERGAATYDGADLAAIRSIKSLIEAGMPETILLLLAEIYVRQMGALRQDLLASFGDLPPEATPDPRPDEIDDFVTATSTQVEVYLSHFEVLLTYLHRRTLERLAVEAVEVSEYPPVGHGVR
jgi:DNA-binding transcriptional MerR regulator